MHEKYYGNDCANVYKMSKPFVNINAISQISALAMMVHFKKMKISALVNI